MVKELSELTLDELWQLFPIILKEYNPEYKEWYLEEQAKLCTTIGKSNIVRVNHIGSTCIEGLVSKPTVDILLEIVPEFSIIKVVKKLERAGWILMHSEDTPELNYIFNKGYTKYGFAERVFHLHVRNPGDWGELYFRDLLSDEPELARDYGNLKSELIKIFRNNRDGYTEAKSEFIKRETERARELYNGRYLLKFS